MNRISFPNCSCWQLTDSTEVALLPGRGLSLIDRSQVQSTCFSVGSWWERKKWRRTEAVRRRGRGDLLLSVLLWRRGFPGGMCKDIHLTGHNLAVPLAGINMRPVLWRDENVSPQRKQPFLWLLFTIVCSYSSNHNATSSELRSVLFSQIINSITELFRCLFLSVYFNGNTNHIQWRSYRRR